MREANRESGLLPEFPMDDDDEAAAAATEGADDDDGGEVK
jgi:hypothetical protein